MRAGIYNRNDPKMNRAEHSVWCSVANRITCME